MMMADDGRINHSKSKGIEVRNDVRGSLEGGARFNVGGLICYPGAYPTCSGLQQQRVIFL